MGSRCDTSRTVHIDADVVVPSEGCGSGVESDADQHLAVFRPGKGGERQLNRHRCSNRVGCGFEDTEKGVAFGGDLDTRIGRNRFSDQSVVRFQNIWITIRKLMQETCRTLDVGEQEGDRAGRE